MHSQTIIPEMKFGSLGMRIEPVVLTKEGQRDVAGEADRSNKEWRQEVTPDLRNLLVRKLVQAMTTTLKRLEKELATDDAQARKIEGDIFHKANSRREYYNEIADAVYKMQTKFGVEEEDEDITVTKTLPLRLDWSLGTPAIVTIKTLEEEADRPINSQYTKEWHQRTTPDLRTLLVRKLTKAMAAAADYSEARDVGLYARKMEWELFELANDKSEYYQLIEEKMYMLEKEQEAKQLERGTQQKSVEEQRQEPEGQEQQPQLEEQHQPELEAQQQPQLEEQRQPELEAQQQPQLEAQQQRQPRLAIVRPSLMVLLITILLGILYEYVLAPFLY